MYKVFSYRLYPTKAQERRMELFRKTCCCWWNKCLDERKTAYHERGERISRFDQIRKITPYRASDPFGAQVPHHVLQNVVDHLELAFKAFFRRVAAGEKAGYPRFKSFARFSSFGYKQYNHSFKIDGRRLRLQGIGRVAVRWHRPIEGRIKTLIIKLKAGKWYAFFACVVEPKPLPATWREVGIDVGVTNLVTLSTGEAVPNPKWYHQAQRRLRVLQRRQSRQQLGGKNRAKVNLQLQRQHARVVNQRNDALNKIVHRLIADYDRIGLEKLLYWPMVKNRHMAKSITNAGWGYLASHLVSKAEEAGRVVCFVDPRRTSKTCSRCGAINTLLRKRERRYRCKCGLDMDRDYNAAINILARAGQVRWASSSPVGELAQEAADKDRAEHHIG